MFFAVTGQFRKFPGELLRPLTFRLKPWSTVTHARSSCCQNITALQTLKHHTVGYSSHSRSPVWNTLQATRPRPSSSCFHPAVILSVWMEPRHKSWLIRAIHLGEFEIFPMCRIVSAARQAGFLLWQGHRKWIVVDFVPKGKFYLFVFCQIWNISSTSVISALSVSVVWACSFPEA